MADITSGTVTANPLGDMWSGVIEHDAASAGDVVGVQDIMGRKIGGIIWAQENSGTVASTFSTTSGSVTLVSGGSTFLNFKAKSVAE